MVVLDDYLDQDLFQRILASIRAESFPWERSRVLRPAPVQLSPEDNMQYVHGFFLNSPRHQYQSKQFDIIRPIIERLNPTELIKAKLNLTPRRDRHIEYGLHLDTRRAGATTAVFYLNSNNGYTYFDPGEKIRSVANRMVLFDSARQHTGASCTDEGFRLVLNINMIMDEGPPKT